MKAPIIDTNDPYPHGKGYGRRIKIDSKRTPPVKPVLVNRTEQTAASIRLLDPDGEMRAMIIALRADNIIVKWFKEILAMDLTPEVRDKLLSLRTELQADAKFVSSVTGE